MRTALAAPAKPHLPATTQAASPPPGFPPRSLLVAVLRQWPIVALTVGIAVGAMAAYCGIAERRYRARATVLIDARSPQRLASQRVGEEGYAPTNGGYDDDGTQLELLRSPHLAARVIEELRLDRDPRFLPRGRVDEAPAGPATAPALVQHFGRALHVARVRGTRLVSVEFESRDPVLAAAVANAHVRLFVRSALEQLDQATEQRREFLQAKLAGLQGRLHAAEMALRAYRDVHRLLPADLTRSVATERVSDLSRRLTAAEAETNVLAEQHRLVQERQADALHAVVSSPAIQKIRQELSRLEAEHALLAERFRPAHPRLQQLAGQIDAARNRLRAEIAKVAAGVEASYVAAGRTVFDLRKSLASERRLLVQRKDADGALLRLTHDVETARAWYENALARVQELDVARGTDGVDIRVTEPAMVPPWPSAPATRADLLLSLMVGLVLGTVLAMLRGARIWAVRNRDAVTWPIGRQPLVMIPDLDHPPAISASEGPR